MRNPLWIFALLIMPLVLLAAAPAAAQAWRALPLIQDGHIAPGWTQIGWGKFVVDGDSLRAEPDGRGLGLLVYEKEKLGDCQIRVVFRSQKPQSNSGVYVRIADGILDWRGKKTTAVTRQAGGGLSPEMAARMQKASENREGPWYAVHHGYEIQICDSADPFHRTGAVYSLAKSSYEANKPADAWKTMIITLRGRQIAVDVDGERVTTFDPTSADIPPQKEWYEPARQPPRPEKGYLGLQTHDPGDIVFFREVSVR